MRSFDGFSFAAALQSSPPQVSCSLARLVGCVDLNAVSSCLGRAELLGRAIQLFRARGTRISNLSGFLRLAIYRQAEALGGGAAESQSMPVQSMPDCLPQALAAAVLNYQLHEPASEAALALDEAEIRALLDLLMDVPREADASYALSVFSALAHCMGHAIRAGHLTEAQALDAIAFCIRAACGSSPHSGVAAGALDPPVGQYLRENVDRLPELMRRLSTGGPPCACPGQLKAMGLVTEHLGQPVHCFPELLDILSQHFKCPSHGESLLVEAFALLREQSHGDIVRYARSAAGENLLGMARDTLVNDKRLAARAQALALLSKAYAGAPADLAGGMSGAEILAAGLTHSDAEYRHIRMEALEGLVSAMGPHGREAQDLLLARLAAEAEGGCQSLQALANIALLLNASCVAGENLSLGREAAAGLRAAAEKLAQQPGDRGKPIDPFRTAAVNLFCFMGASADLTADLMNEVSEAALRLALTWPAAASPEHPLLHRLLSQGYFKINAGPYSERFRRSFWKDTPGWNSCRGVPRRRCLRICLF